jgi:hypothetical protein
MLVSAKTMVHLILPFLVERRESKLLGWHFIVLVPNQSLEMGMLITGVDMCLYCFEQGASSCIGT